MSPHYQGIEKGQGGWLDEGIAPHRYQSPKERYRHIYFEVLELVKGEIGEADFHLI